MSFILFMTPPPLPATTTPLQLPYVSCFVPSSYLCYCQFEFAVWIVFPSLAASQVATHRCNYAPIISTTHPRTQKQAGRETSSLSARWKISKTNTNEPPCRKTLRKIESERPPWILTASIDGYKRVHRMPEDACQQSEEKATADPGQGDLRLLM